MDLSHGPHRDSDRLHIDQAKPGQPAYSNSRLVKILIKAKEKSVRDCAYPEVLVTYGKSGKTGKQVELI
jgi:hypothetical protein